MNSIKQLLTATAVLLTTIAVAQKPYTLKGVLGTKGKPVMVYLRYQLGEHKKTDSTRIKEGRFAISGSIPGVVKAYLEIKCDQPGKEGPSNTFIYLEPKPMSLVYLGKEKQYKLSGSITQLEFDAMDEEIEKQSRSNAKDYGDIQKKIYRKFIVEHPNSVLSLDLMRQAYRDEPSAMEKAITTLSPALQKSKSGQDLLEKATKQQAIAIGQIAPDFSEADTTGKMVSLKDFRGKYVLLDFWASWCGPCRAENPHVLAAYKKYKDRNFTILSVSVDDKRSEWIKALKEDKLPWTHISNLNRKNAAGADLYNVEFIPANWLIDPEGRIIAKGLRGDKLENLDEYIK